MPSDINEENGKLPDRFGGYTSFWRKVKLTSPDLYLYKFLYNIWGIAYLVIALLSILAMLGIIR
jgi:hypothetical protein